MKRKILTTFVMILLLSSSVVIWGEGQVSADTPDIPSGAIPVSTPDDLARIGTGANHGGYTWSSAAYYYLTNDIVFGSIDTNGGVSVGLHISISDSTLTVTISGITIYYILYVNLSGTVRSSSNNTVTVPVNTVGSNQLITVAGNISGGGTFVYSTRISTTNGNTISSTFNSNGNFSPRDFTGTLNGDGYTISGLIVKEFNYATNLNTGALFKSTSGNAVISKLGVIDASVLAIHCTSSTSYSGDTHAGGLVGSATNTSISDCYVTGSVSAISGSLEGVSASNAYSGGLVGTGTTTNISRCYNSATIRAFSSPGQANAGGLVGTGPSANIYDCHNTGQIIIDLSIGHARAGGLVGYRAGMISKSYNAGTITIQESRDMSSAGGIIGGITGNMAISNCYNVAAISVIYSLKQVYIGGVAGSMGGAQISNSYNVGSLSSGSSATEGGIAGSAGSPSAQIVNCYFTNGLNTCGAGTVTIDGTSTPARSSNQSSGSKTVSEMQPTLETVLSKNSIFFTGTTVNGSNTYDGWDFVTIWTVSGGFPFFKELTPVEISSTPSKSVTSENKWTYKPVTTPASVTISISGNDIDWLSVAQDGTISGFAPVISEESKEYELTITASAHGFLDGIQTITITVKRDEPVSEPMPIMDVEARGDLTYHFSAARSIDAESVSWAVDDFMTDALEFTRILSIRGAFKVSLTVTNSAGSVDLSTYIVHPDSTPLDTAARGEFYYTIVLIDTPDITFYSTASWLSYEVVEDINGDIYAIVSGVAPTASFGLTYTVELNDIVWTVTVGSGSTETIAYFTILSISDGTITVRNNSANATIFTWYWDQDDATKYTNTGDPSGTVTHTYKESGEYTIRLKAQGTGVATYERTFTITISEPEPDDVPDEEMPPRLIDRISENPILIAAVLGVILLILGFFWRPLAVIGIAVAVIPFILDTMGVL